MLFVFFKLLTVENLVISIELRNSITWNHNTLHYITYTQTQTHTQTHVYTHILYISLNHKNYNFLEFDWSIYYKLQYFIPIYVKSCNQIIVYNRTVLIIIGHAGNPIIDHHSNGPITSLVLHGCLFDWQGQLVLTNYFQSYSFFFFFFPPPIRNLLLGLFPFLRIQCNLL